MKFLTKPIVKSILAFGIVAGTVGCASQGGSFENAEFRADRAAEVTDHASFSDCNQTAIMLSGQATRPALYHNSAKQALRCLSDVADNASSISRSERMQLHALAIVNFAKSGEINSAQTELALFMNQYPFDDLYLANGASFTDTMSLMLGEVSPRQAATSSLSNSTRELKSEFRRQQFWTVN